MARIIPLESRQKKEARLIAGMHNGDQHAQYELHKYCSDYYYSNHKGVFYAPEEALDEIFQNAFIKFWENIELGKIYVNGNIVMGKDNKPLNGSIRTYFMGIAKFKYLEWYRENSQYASEYITIDTKLISRIEQQASSGTNYGDSDNIQLDIISDLISNMPTRCYEILSKFYHEGKDLDKILEEIPSIDSKNALKTKKHKCMTTLRDVANETYRQYLAQN